MGQTPAVIFKYACHLLTRPRSHIRICTRHVHAHTQLGTHGPGRIHLRFLVIATKTQNLDASRSFPKTPEWRANFKQPLALLSFFLRPPFLILSFQGEKKAGFPFCCLLKRGKVLYALSDSTHRQEIRAQAAVRGRATRRDSRERTTNQARSSLITSAHVQQKWQLAQAELFITAKRAHVCDSVCV